MLDSVDTPGLTAFEFATVGSAQGAAEYGVCIVHHHNAGARRRWNNGQHGTLHRETSSSCGDQSRDAGMVGDCISSTSASSGWVSLPLSQLATTLSTIYQYICISTLHNIYTVMMAGYGDSAPPVACFLAGDVEMLL